VDVVLYVQYLSARITNGLPQTQQVSLKRFFVLSGDQVNKFGSDNPGAPGLFSRRIFFRQNLTDQSDMSIRIVTVPRHSGTFRMPFSAVKDEQQQPAKNKKYDCDPDHVLCHFCPTKNLASRRSGALPHCSGHGWTGNLVASLS